MSRRAPFIVIEGLDRSGKSTQAALLLARFEAAGLPAKLIKFPGTQSDLPNTHRESDGILQHRPHDGHRSDDKRVPTVRIGS
jgi:thymidylate kinase